MKLEQGQTCQPGQEFFSPENSPVPTPLPQRQIPMARALLSVKKGATPTTEGRYLETTLKSKEGKFQDSHGSEAKAGDEAIA